MQLRKELLDTKTRLTHESQETQQKLERLNAEIQTLQDELQNVELQKLLLDRELSKKTKKSKTLKLALVLIPHLPEHHCQLNNSSFY